MTADRQPMRRGREPGMDLPPGRSCADCVHCKRCTSMFGHIPQDEVCDWSPSRFHLDAGKLEYASWFPVQAATPAADWRARGEADPHGDRYDCERAELAMGNLTDDELANGVFLHGDGTHGRAPLSEVVAGRAFWPIAWLTAAKDRIRWLSRALERERAASQQPAGHIRQIVSEQAEDAGLWFDATTVTEAHLQAALRRLHAAVEASQQPAGYVTAIEEGKVLMLPRASLNTDGMVPLYASPPAAERGEQADSAPAVESGPLEDCHGMLAGTAGVQGVDRG